MGHEIYHSLLLMRQAKMSQNRSAKCAKKEEGAKSTEGHRCGIAGLAALIWRRKLAKKRRLASQAPILVPEKEEGAMPLLPPKPPLRGTANRRSLSAGTSFPLFLPFLSIHPPSLDHSQLPPPPPNGAIAELVATETDYIAQLEVCQRVYMRAFRRWRRRKEADGIGCTETELFGNWSQIRHFHRSLLHPRLLLAQATPFSTVHLFLQLAPFLRRIYLPFLESRGRFGHLLQNRTIQQWAKAIALRHGLGPAQSLDSLLIRPVQRLFQLAALLGRIECPKGDALLGAVQAEAVHRLRHIPRLANDRLHLQRLLPFSTTQSKLALAQLGNLLCSDTFRIKANKRAAKLLAGGGSRRRRARKKVRQCRVFLFCRGLLLAKRRKGRKREEGLKPIGCIPLCRLVRLGWDGGTDFCLFLRCSYAQSSRRRRPGKIRFRADSEPIAREWMRRLGAEVCRAIVGNWLLP